MRELDFDGLARLRESIDRGAVKGIFYGDLKENVVAALDRLMEHETLQDEIETVQDEIETLQDRIKTLQDEIETLQIK